MSINEEINVCKAGYGKINYNPGGVVHIK